MISSSCLLDRKARWESSRAFRSSPLVSPPYAAPLPDLHPPKSLLTPARSPPSITGRQRRSSLCAVF